MRSNDSTKTRVVPVFNHLLRLDRTGASWLDRLVRLGSRVDLAVVPQYMGLITNNLPSLENRKEKALPPPPSLLEWLVQNITPEAVAEAVAKRNLNGVARRKREALAGGDPEILSEALYHLRKIPAGKNVIGKWFILEGPTYPDFFLETDTCILVVEGKRTEKYLESDTTWMSHRPQLIRHMDAAQVIANGRTVLSLLLVEGKADDPMSVPDKWAGALEQHIQPEMLALSLPHRSNSDRKKIVDGVLGIATWQRLCNEFSISWPLTVDDV